MKHFVENWRNITSDDNVLDLVQHCHIEFMKGENPVKHRGSISYFSPEEDIIIDKEIQKLVSMEVLKEVEHHPDEFISPIFIIPKKNGEYRMILNLKQLNQYVEYHHFKMESFESALKLVKPGMYFASVDLRHAYYSVPIAEEHQVKLRFMKSGKIYQYLCLPNGISCAPKQFTKLMKPVYASLRMLGHKNSGYIDDSLLMGDTYSECSNNVTDTVHLMRDVGFMIHEEKSVLVPARKITFLGNDIDSEKMVVTLPESKVDKIVQACLDLHSQSRAKIRDVARVVGLMVSSFSAVDYAPLHFRSLERAKIVALQEHAGDYESVMVVTPVMRDELKWWIDNLSEQNRKICHGIPDIVISTDASSLGWGAVCNGVKIGGLWYDHEACNSINYLELLAASHAVKSFCKNELHKHIQIKSDNTSAVSYIRNMGGKITNLNRQAKDCWQWCIDRHLWLSATYVPGVENEADYSSRHFNVNTEWKLSELIFSHITQEFGMPDIDMFASRLNKQIQRFVSWKPDPEAEEVDAFSVSWQNKYIYAFPPFSLIGRVLQKAQQEVAEILLVAPVWLTQNWFPEVMEMLIDHPFILKVNQDVLTIPQSNRIHPLAYKLHLMVCRISGDHSKSENFRMTLLTSSWRHGDPPLKSNIPRILTDGFSSVVKGKKIFFKPL